MQTLWRTVLLCLCWSLACHSLTVWAETGKAGSARAKRAPRTQEVLAVERGAALSRRAEQHWAKGEYAQAETLWQRALAIQEQALGPAHPNVAATLHSLADLYWARGEYGRVEPLLQRTLAIEEHALGPEHPTVAITLHSLAYLSQAKGEYNHAMPLFQRALAIEERALSPEHPAVAATLHSLAGVYVAKGEYDHAEPLFQRALAIWEKAEGPEHPYVATTLDSLAGLYVIKGDYERAEPLFQRGHNGVLHRAERVAERQQQQFARLAGNEDKLLVSFNQRAQRAGGFEHELQISGTGQQFVGDGVAVAHAPYGAGFVQEDCTLSPRHYGLAGEFS